MILLKSEAKKKWCPFARVVIEEIATVSAFNRVTSRSDLSTLKTYPSTNCISLDCMLWTHVSDNTGYCGLGDRGDRL